MKEKWDDYKQCWVNENGGRICTFNNDTLIAVVNNCKEFIQKRDTIYLEDIRVLLEKALEGVRDKKDLSDSEIDTIKRIRVMLKGL